MVSGDQSAVTLHFAPLLVIYTSPRLRSVYCFFFITCFQQLDYDLPWFSSLYVSSALVSLSFWHLSIEFSSYLKKW